jgi:Carboxypeptidase regulatory-like domain/TonB dependent receptor
LELVSSNNISTEAPVRIMNTNAIKRLSVSAVMIVLTAGLAIGQAVSGDLVGTITDQSGAAVPGVIVTVTDTATGITATTKSDTNGEYRFGNLLIGVYDISASSMGFASAVIHNFDVQLNKTATANLVLAVAGASTIVEVTDSAPPIDTTTAQVQTTFGQKQAQDSPTAAIGLGVLNLSLLSAGVANTGGIGAGEGPSVGGQRPRNNNFTIEGVDNNNKALTGPLVFIPNDAVQNFTVLQNQYSPEFGHSSGGQFNTVINSGTNTFHGRLYEYFQNRNLDAIDAATARNGNSTNPRYDQNRLGFQIGGPVIKNKVFFFSNLEYNPVANGISSQVCAPTTSGYATLANTPGISKNNLQVLQKFLPAGTVPDVNNVACASSTEAITSGNGTVNVPVALFPIAGSTFTNQYYSTNSIDWNVSDKDQVRGRYVYNKLDGLDAAAGLPAFFQTEPQRFHLFTLSEFHTFSPNLTNEFRLGYNRFSQIIPSGNFVFPGLDQFPNITIDSLTANVGPNPNAPQSTVQNTYQAVENLSWVKGKHSFKFGVEGRKYISPQSFTQRQRGDYEYGSLDVFLRDLSPDQFGERSTGNFFYYGDQSAIYAYGNDTWRVTKNLSLNLGLRYEFTSVPTGERTQALNSAASVPGLIDFKEPQPQYGNFAPRLGFAYSPGDSGNTSIRGGFGIAYDVLYDNLGTLSFPPQFSGTQDVNTNVSTPNFLASGGLPPGTGGLQTFPTVQAQRAATAAFVPDQKLPYSEEWNLGVQHVFNKTYTVEVRYLGSRGIHLPVQDRLNRQAVVGPDNFLPTFIDPATVPSQTQLNTMKTLDQVQAFRSSFVPAFAAAGFASNVTAFEPFGSSIYHGLASSITRRFDHGLEFNLAYTWSHLIDDSTADVFSTLLTPRRPQDPQNIAADRSTSALDRRQRLTISAIYDLPFFKQSNWMMKNLVGNWEIAPIYTFESPEYASVQSAQNSNLAGDTFPTRAIFNPQGTPGVGSGVSPLTNSQGQIVGYVANNPNAQYIVAGIGALTNASRNTLALPRTNNWDLSLVKRVGINERMSFEFLAQAYNVFNHSQYVPGSINQINAVNLIGQPLNFTTTATRNFLTPSSPTFDKPNLVFPNNARTMQLGAKFIF